MPRLLTQPTDLVNTFIPDPVQFLSHERVIGSRRLVSDKISFLFPDKCFEFLLSLRIFAFWKILLLLLVPDKLHLHGICN